MTAPRTAPTANAERVAVPEHAAGIAEVVAAARAVAASGARTVLGIVGTPGAGKSTLAADLVEALAGDAVLLGMDAFHLGNAQLERLGRRARKGAPDTFDAAGYRATLRRIRERAEDVYVPVFDRGIEESIAAAAVIPTATPIVVTEGNYLLLGTDGWAGTRELLDACWYVDIEAEERIARLEARRIGHGHPADAAAAWVREVDEPNAAIIETTRDTADLVWRFGAAGWERVAIQEGNH